jgi:hypothetical protein
MNKYQNFFLLFLTSLLLLNCGNENSAEQTGSIYYYSSFDESNRMHVRDGMEVLFSYPLEYNPAPKGAADGDSGRNLHLSFKDQSLLQAGKTYELPNPSIKAAVSEWGSPASFQLNRGLRGSISIKKVVPYQEVQLNVDLKLQTGLNEFKEYHSSLNFKSNRFHRSYGQNSLDLEAYDGSYEKGSLLPSDLEGKWIQTAEIFHDKTLGLRSYFYLPNPLRWEFQSGRFIEMNNAEIKINDGRLLFKDKNGVDQFYAINHFSQDSLIITNLNATAHNRYTFVRK